MKTLSKYSVSFTGLPNGVHAFTYKIDDSFFANKEYSPVKSGDLEVELQFDKRDRFFVLNFHYAGVVKVLCDRCLSEVKIPINGAASLLVKTLTGDEENLDLADDEVMYINPNDIAIDFSQFLYENIVVNIPLYKTCEDDIRGDKTCDEDVLAILDGNEEQKDGETDPRWEKLKELKNK